MTELHRLKSTLDGLTEWYWNHGRQRKGRYAIDKESWLSPLYEAKQLGAALSREDDKKKVIALWGPSQVGKSTLLSRYLDHNAAPDGTGSILQWDKSSPVRFENTAAIPDVTSINPYNFRSDASAVITRFSIRDSIEDPRHPVEVRLAERLEIAHALTVGYISDWKRDRKKIVSDAEIAEIALSLSGKHPESEESFKQVFEVASLVSQLSRSTIQDNPFASITQNAATSLLNCNPLSQGTANSGLYGGILWGKDQQIDLLFHDLLDFKEKVKSKTSGAIRCCYKTAALLLDMSSYPNAIGGQDIEGKSIEPNGALKERILSIGYRIENGNLLLAVGEGTPFFNEERDFALFQGLTWQITLPIRRAAALNHGASLKSFTNLLDNYDILDFPGVSNIGTGSELDDNLLKEKGDHLLFTHLLKMGKTSAMISATTKAQVIDRFCLLLRTMSPLSRPGTLIDGLRNWRRSLGQNSKANLHVLNTFFADLVNDLIKNPTADHFGQALSPLKALGSSIEGAQFHPISFWKYQKLFNQSGEPLTPETGPAIIETVATRMVSQPQFNSLFRLDAKALVNVIAEGGIDHLLKGLTNNFSSSESSTAANLIQELGCQVETLIKAVSPETSEDVDVQLLQTWKDRIHRTLAENKPFNHKKHREVAFSIREILHFDSEHVPPIPMNLRVKPEEALPYIEDVLTQWRERTVPSKVLQNACIKNSVEKSRLLFIFSKRINPRDAARWLIQNFGRVSSSTVAKNERRFLAIYLTNFVSPKAEVNPASDPFQQVIAYASAELDPLEMDANLNPEFQSVIAPTLSLLAKMQENPMTSGEAQPGDAEILKIERSFKAK